MPSGQGVLIAQLSAASSGLKPQYLYIVGPAMLEVALPDVLVPVIEDAVLPELVPTMDEAVLEDAVPRSVGVDVV